MSLVVVDEHTGATEAEDAEIVKLSSLRTPVGDFLKNNGLGNFADKFREQGFHYAGDVLGLTPRKYKIVGVDSLGDTLRLSHVLDLEVGIVACSLPLSTLAVSDHPWSRPS